MSSAPLQMDQLSPQIPENMRAGVYRDVGRIVVEDVPVPEIGDGEVLIRIAACGICGTDVKKIRHGLVRPPQILGHELAGTIARVGAGVRRANLGPEEVAHAGARLVELRLTSADSTFEDRRTLFV